MAKHTVGIEIEVPEGWRPTGEYRRPSVGEYYLSYNSVVLRTIRNLDLETKLILVRDWEWPTHLFDDTVTSIRYAEGQWWRVLSIELGRFRAISMEGIKWDPPTRTPQERQEWFRPNAEGQ
jgi:hypothetical protein